VTKPRRLNVWRRAELLGTLDQTRSGLRFVYERAAVERVGLGRPLISMSLPTSNRPYFDRAARPFFDGLLPEGEARRIIAYDRALPEVDTFGLLCALGRECAGALTILSDDESPPTNRPVGTLDPLSSDALDQLIRNLRFNPLGVDDNVRVSLAGVQEKLVLTALPGQRWALPTAEVASTHIFKPAIAGIEDGAQNEAACLRFAQACGVPAARSRVEQIGDRDVLIVERYDRTVGSDGDVDRVHQETACQALAVPVAATARKYQESGGPSLQAVAAVVRRWAGPEPLEAMLQQLTINMLVGNADAHAMNLSFLIDDNAEISIAPMYDVFSTIAYPTLSTTVGMFVDDVADIRRITRHDLVSEATRWGLDPERAAAIVGALCDQAEAALDTAMAATGTRAPMFVPVVRDQVRRFVLAP
jgi:serine/threonine-protein kinase HipA